MVCKPLEKTKEKHKKGLWSPDEDSKLKNYILKYGHGCWSSIPVNAGLQRNGKSCRLRWINYLRPGLKRGVFDAQEEDKILALHRLLGNKWSHIAQHVPGRTDNEIKNFWHTCLKKKSFKQEESESQNPTPAVTSPNTRNDNRYSSDLFSPNSNFKRFEKADGSTNNYNLPKVLFAEWLSLNQFQNQDFVRSSNQLKENYENYLSSGDNTLTGFSGVLNNEYRKDIVSNGNGDGMIIHSEFKSKSWFHESGFANFISEGVMCSDTNINNDDMYDY